MTDGTIKQPFKYLDVILIANINVLCCRKCSLIFKATDTFDDAQVEAIINYMKNKRYYALNMGQSNKILNN
jgi:hypothetical protein